MPTNNPRKTDEPISRDTDPEIVELRKLLDQTGCDSRSKKLRKHWPSLDEILAAAGWSPQRKTDIDLITAQLTALKVTVNPFAKDFLCSYNGLSVAFPRKHENETYKYTFDAVNAINEYTCSSLGRAQNIIKRTLCPIAQSEDEMIILLIDDTGRVFASVDRDLNFVANDYKEALLVLSMDRPFQALNKEHISV